MEIIDHRGNGAARKSDYARALHELQRLAMLIPLLTEPEGQFVGEISRMLQDCLQVRGGRYGLHAMVGSELWRDIRDLGIWFRLYLGRLSAFGHPVVQPRFTLYTSGSRLYGKKVMYPRSWYEDSMFPELLAVHTRQMIRVLCKVLKMPNIVLYISNTIPPGLPPWSSDVFLKKQLMTSSLSEDYYGGLNYNIRLEKFRRQLAMRDASGKARTTATDHEDLSESIKTSMKQKPPWNTKTIKDSGQTGSDVMEIDWIDWDKMFPSKEDGQPSSSSRPPFVEVSDSQYEMLQSRQLPVIHKLVPAEGIAAGGTEITLLGSGFYQGLEVWFGDSEATTTIFWAEKCLSCVVPPALQSGSVKVRFKHAHLQDFRTQQEPQSQACTYNYIDDLKDEMQSSGFDKKSTSQQQMSAEVGATISASSVSKTSPILLTNLAILKYLAECQAALDVLSTKSDKILKQVRRALISLMHALERGPLDEDIILSAILLWSIEKIRNDQSTAERHWDGIKELMKLCPGFDIGAPLSRVCFLASLTLTNNAYNSMIKISEVIATAFGSVIESTIDTGDDGQTVAIPSALTPAATVYSPWSETDAEPPPYMLSPTQLKQACLIYAAVNVRSNDQADQDSGSPV